MYMRVKSACCIKMYVFHDTPANLAGMRLNVYVYGIMHLCTYKCRFKTSQGYTQATDEHTYDEIAQDANIFMHTRARVYRFATLQGIQPGHGCTGT